MSLMTCPFVMSHMPREVLWCIICMQQNLQVYKCPHFNARCRHVLVTCRKRVLKSCNVNFLTQGSRLDLELVCFFKGRRGVFLEQNISSMAIEAYFLNWNDEFRQGPLRHISWMKHFFKGRWGLVLNEINFFFKGHDKIKSTPQSSTQISYWFSLLTLRFVNCSILK